MWDVNLGRRRVGDRAFPQWLEGGTVNLVLPSVRYEWSMADGSLFWSRLEQADGWVEAGRLALGQQSAL